MFVQWGLRALSEQPSQHTRMSKASQVGFWLIPLTVQISHKLWLDGRNFSGERKLPGGLKPICPPLPNFLAVVLQDEAEGSWPVLSPSGGPWLRAASRDSRSLESPWATHSCTREVKSLLQDHRGSYLPIQLPKFSQICGSCKLVMIILIISEKLR